MKKGDYYTEQGLVNLGYEILTRFCAVYIWKKKDDVAGRHLMWDFKSGEVILMYGEEERFCSGI